MKKERLVLLDFARTLAIILVVLTHAIECIYIEPHNSLPIGSAIFESCLFFITRLGVPLFLFLTGVLVLKKEFKNEDDIKKFYKKNLLPIVISTEVFNIVYYLFLCFVNNISFDLVECIKYLLFIKQVNMPHMWYMPMIIGVYISLPFLSILIEKLDLCKFKFIILLFIVLRFLFPTITPFLNLCGKNGVGNIIDTNLLGSCYVLYIILGYYIYHKKILRNFSLKKLIIIFLISCFTGVFSQLLFSKYLYNDIGYYRVWYDSLFILICSTMLFEIILRMKKDFKKTGFILNLISRYAFSIFLLHEFIIVIYCKYIYFKINNNPIETILLFIITFVISFGFSFFISKTKRLHKIFLIK